MLPKINDFSIKIYGKELKKNYSRHTKTESETNSWYPHFHTFPFLLIFVELYIFLCSLPCLSPSLHGILVCIGTMYISGHFGKSCYEAFKWGLWSACYKLLDVICNVTFLTRQKRGDGVGYTSVICEYVLFPLVNKEADLANSLAE